ncbi:MAG: hypothetical protein RBS19_02990 [Bacteroidales bacterium]|nr:hypothetical protein [Bacteroidales bacterium]MDY0215902.1 hypothetical protein [Bacteroidales bacterium]
MSYFTSTSNSQNYNRFSYVLNNPLKYVDPSGYVAMNPWYEYQAGPHTKFYTWMPDYEEFYPDNQGRMWKYHGETINTPGFYGDETGMWISKLNEHNELIYSYNELRQIVQNNANSNSFFSSFSSGAGTLRVEGEVGRGNASNNGGSDPYMNSHGEPVYTMNEFINTNQGLTRNEIINQRQDRSKTFLGSQTGGPNMRYVKNPHDGKVLDMRHMLIVGNRPPIVGNLLEGFQWITGQASGMDPQDFYSNGVGYQFYMQSNVIQRLIAPTSFTDQLNSTFLVTQK